MKPIFTYIKDFFASDRFLGKDQELRGLIGVESILKSLVTDKVVPGISISVKKEGVSFFKKGFGYADLNSKIKISPDHTIFRIASVSKPISATALACMVEDGGISLDASFYSYVPYYPKKEWDFTIRQLASHTAGIRGYEGMEYGLNRDYSIREGIQVFKESNLVFKPGTAYHYNSFDWTLISLAMQEASGIPFEDYVKKKVLEPLGMNSTFSSKEEEILGHKKLTTFYSKNRCGFRESIPVNNFYKLAGGGFLSTATDIVELGQAYLEEKILNSGTRNEFLTAQKIEGKSTYYGLGWQVSFDKKGRPFYGHIGNGVGGYSNFFVYPKQQLVISILVNCTDPKIQNSLDKVVHMLADMVDAMGSNLDR